jgi:hypothetical protein
VRRWKLTIRHGPEVEHEEFDDLDAAVAAMRSKAEAIREEGPLAPSSALREFAPGEQVHARLQITGPGVLRKPSGGIDVKGDGSLVAFSGTMRRKELEPAGPGSPYEAVQESLSGSR